jgi:hypothetical protein
LAQVLYLSDNFLGAKREWIAEFQSGHAVAFQSGLDAKTDPL